MEVATTNNHSQSHHHHHLSGGNGGAGGGGNGGSRSPFQREVREWQRIDPDTGALFSGRLEADRWINGPLNSYGKISDSQNISQPNGTQHTQRKQMEVLRTANGAMQVIRTQTVQKTSSTSRWSTSSSTKTTTRSSTGAAPMALWAPRTSRGVDICELSNNDDDDDDDKHDDYVDDDEDSIHNGSDAGVVHECMTASTPSTGYGQELVDDHVDFVVLNGHADVDDAADDDDDVAHLHKLGHNLLLDTAPSLKLSNLMKSSSSISSQSSNNSNLTTAAATAAAAAAAAVAGNTHRNAGKISLHAIVGQTTTATTAAAATSSSSGTLSTWPQRLEQADLYGQANNNGFSSSSSGSGSQKRRVGVAADVAAVATPTLRRDLESFRHHDDAATAAAADDDDDVDEDLRLSARHQRRQQVSQSVYAPPLPASFGSLQRSRSISTDDLSNDWQQRGEEQTEEELPCGDWRRVSKLRRSFQSQDYHNKAQARPRPLPLDLPSSTVSVARIRAELENGRRLNTAMRNNHVDLAALDSILNSTAAAVAAAGAAASATAQSSSKPQLAKRSTFLTAASLQEIRGKLKKLSDESLYKEDFLAHQAIAQPAAVEVVQAHVPATSAPSAFRVVHNTHSLETRQRPKDSSSSEWHLRRKSYGFEKMSPPENRSIFRVDASTDSGLGRSGEQLGNWSPTERSAAAAANGAGSTIIHFGRQQVGKPASPSEAEQLSKRHSIAVEETWRDIRKTSQVHVNGESINGSSSNNSSSQLQRSSAQKRVEFCKTEVHFAAESGRVNIVETDGKPPPTQNFRRRRRTASGPLQSLVKSASVTSSSSSCSSSNVTHFGDDPIIRNKTIASSTVAYRATVMEPPELVTQPVSGTQVTVITKPLVEPRYSLLETTSSTSRHSYTSTSGMDTTDNETDELANIRGILKNKPVKPKPYHLGENIESADVLWSMPATIKSENRENSPPSRESAAGDSPITTKSVAERVRIVEQRQFDKQQQQPSPAGNGYSTKINVSLGAEDWSETDLPKSNVMNIALHAPRLQKPKPTPPTLRIGQLVPVAKPRTLLVQPQPQAQVVDNADESGSESLKIVKEARGARKLREHELSYFGVQHSPTPPQTTKLHVTPSNPRRTLPTRNKLSHNEEATTATTSTTTTTTKWQLLNDRPDLLRHSPQANDESNAFPEDDEEHCYENIANELTTTFRVKSPSPGSYERKTDLQRDAQILSEMTRNADQTLKALSDEAAFKDQRRRSCSLQRRSGKLLATIDEKVKTHNGDAKALSVARGTFASEARRNSRQSTPSPTRARSSSQSSIECCPRDRSRSSSRESMTQGGGSSDDQLSKQRVERIRIRTPKREKTRHETTEQRSSRQSSKPRSSSNATPESKRTHHHSRHREKEHSGDHSAKHSSGSASGSRLIRSTRVSETSRPRTSSHRTSERERERDRASGTEKHREELTRSRGHSSRSRHSEQSAAGHKSSKSTRSNHHDTAMSAHRKSTTAGKVAATKATTAATATTHKSTTTPTTATATASTAATATTTHNELTYVYVTNLANTQTAEDADYASIDEATVTVTPTALPAIPLPPPRLKRKRSLLPVPVQRERTTATPTAAYEHRIKLEMIPQTPSYSNQSTLRCKQQPMRKSSLKCTQSTSSSFAFLPYLPAKRNSSVSHVYDNYLLYAAPATLTASKLRPYQHNLSNEHAQLFGSSGRGGGIVSSGAGAGNGATGAMAGRLGSWPKRLRMRQVRSSVSTHQPFGICTCS
ncbi:serine/arginine repetitive matrix protein 2 isoform X4 [Drosophila montana]|uniref:serine/arginine repetitive matrix protein 2 isoform X4 n=1 Tax=Drosophila montana TaxID=40370 RepID=UPI00313B36C5